MERKMIDTIFASLVPLFLVMILGFVVGLTKDIDNRNIGSLNALVMNFMLPAALFTAMAQTPRDAMIGQANVRLWSRGC
jgi:malonate transporter and related proteins